MKHDAQRESELLKSVEEFRLETEPMLNHVRLLLIRIRMGAKLLDRQQIVYFTALISHSDTSAKRTINNISLLHFPFSVSATVNRSAECFLFAFFKDFRHK